MEHNVRALATSFRTAHCCIWLLVMDLSVPVSPYILCISLYLPASPYISLHLPPQYAFEREEAVQKLSTMQRKAEMSQGGGMKLAQQLTAMEVRYEDMRLRFEKDMAGFIELKLTHAEAQARLADLEDELKQLRLQR